MKIGRNMIIAIMITFCFTASLFMAIPIKSANSPYNPWLDYNENGNIGLTDFVSLANSYGTTGDPTKNVTVTNWPIGSDPNHPSCFAVNSTDNQNVTVTNFPSTYKWQYLSTFNFSEGGYWFTGNGEIYCGGYSKMVIAMTPVSISHWNQNYSITVGIGNVGWWGPENQGWMNENYYPRMIQNVTVEVNTAFLGQPPWYFPSNTPVLIDVKAPYCMPGFRSVSNNAPNGWWVTFDIYAYLRNE